MGKRAIKKSTYQKVKDQLNLPYKKKKLSKSEKRNNIRKEFETENVIIKSSSKTKDICLSKAQKNFSIEKRFKLKPLKSLFIKPNKDINKMTLDELKQFAHKNDLIPEVNFKLLLYLKKNENNIYRKYIEKYKYTLNFQDALTLECFENSHIIKMIKEYNSNIKIHGLKGKIISSVKDIVYFSKIQIFNLLIELQSFDSTDYAEIKAKTAPYTVKQTLIYKIPIKYGNIELKYYFYLLTLMNILFSNDNNVHPSNEEDFTSSLSKGIYFNFIQNETHKKEEIDLKEFYERKKILDEYIKDIKLEYKTSKKKFENKINDESSTILEDLLSKITVIQNFKDVIFELIQLSDDIEIIKRIRIIVYSVHFFKMKADKLDKLVNCFKIDNSSEKQRKAKEKVLKVKKIRDIVEQNNDKHFTFSNIDLLFPGSYFNPFIYKAKYFSFPDFLKQNIIQNDEELYNLFKSLLEYIYKSRIIRDIYYLCPDFNEFCFPFDDKDILEEMFDITEFVPFPNASLWGLTQKEVPEMLIPSVLTKDNPLYGNFSDMVCDLSQILNSSIHEHIRHYIKALIFYNSFQFGITKRISSNLYELDEERRLINSILKKNKNEYDNIPLDGGHKAEVLLYGNILSRIYFPQSLELFKLSNWDKTIPEHIKNFNSCRNKKQSFENMEISKILNDNDYSEFYKLFVKKFKQFYMKENDNIIIYNNDTSSQKTSININKEEKKDYIVYDNNTFATRASDTIRDASC